MNDLNIFGSFSVASSFGRNLNQNVDECDQNIKGKRIIPSLDVQLHSLSLKETLNTSNGRNSKFRALNHTWQQNLNIWGRRSEEIGRRCKLGRICLEDRRARSRAEANEEQHKVTSEASTASKRTETSWWIKLKTTNFFHVFCLAKLDENGKKFEEWKFSCACGRRLTRLLPSI